MAGMVASGVYDVVLGSREPFLEPRDVELRGDHEPTEFVVEFARDRGFLPPRDLLQMARQRRQILGAPPHLEFKFLCL